MVALYGIAAAAFFAGAFGKLFQEPTEELLRKQYDVIVVGAGAAGAVMASRLTEDPTVSVLLIEAGSSDYLNLNITVPGFLNRLITSQFDWNFTTTPQVGLGNRSIKYPRGFVLGGSTAINNMDFCRGSRDDYDRWANVTGDNIWTWDNLYPYILKVDRMTPPADHHNPVGQFDPRVHDDGIVPISVEGYPQVIYPLVTNTTRELPEEFPFKLDVNSGNPIGISWTQGTVHNGHRVSSAASYLAAASDRANLDIVVNTHVTKLLPVGEQDDKPVMRGVEFSQAPEGNRTHLVCLDTFLMYAPCHTTPTYILNATQEVILSAGSIKSPHLLMLSGIGDAAHLSSEGIPSLVNNSHVGQNLQDHPYLAFSWVVNSNDTLDDLHRNSTLMAEALAQWQHNGTGPLSLGPSGQFGWLHVPGAQAFFAPFGIEDPKAGPTSAHFELIVTNAYIPKQQPLPSQGHFFSMITAVISPVSRGSVTLASADPFAQPIINPNLLSSDVDLAVMREAVKRARAFVAAPAWSDFIVAEFSDFADTHTEEALNAFIRSTGDSIYHPVGTVGMGTALDSHLRVKGVKGLRVVDASAFPFIPSGHTQGPTYILAERAAALVKESLKGA